MAILVRSWLILFVSLLLLGSQPARGQEESASVYEEEGARLFLSKSYEGAIKQFTQAYRLDPKPQYLFNIGQSYRKLGLAAEAAEYYQRYLHDEQKIDPTIYADLTQYIDQYYASQEKAGGRPKSTAEPPEPAPLLAAEEIADAEELIAQYVRDYRAGNQAVANEIMDQLKGVLQLRRDLRDRPAPAQPAKGTHEEHQERRRLDAVGQLHRVARFEEERAKQRGEQRERREQQFLGHAALLDLPLLRGFELEVRATLDGIASRSLVCE
ncbi:MAG TPA: hypothetical protein PK472_04335, partial [Pseudomonadota bacterium]|nr:hypothetical protein [Pseudomonadota bacterium]